MCSTSPLLGASVLATSECASVIIVRCQRCCDDHEPGGDQCDLLATSFSGDRARCIPSNISMLDVPQPRSRASSTSSVASDLSSLYPPSIEDTNTGSLLPPSLSRVRRLTPEITPPLMGDDIGTAYGLPYQSSAPDIAHTSSDSYDTTYTGSIPVLY